MIQGFEFTERGRIKTEQGTFSPTLLLISAAADRSPRQVYEVAKELEQALFPGRPKRERIRT